MTIFTVVRASKRKLVFCSLLFLSPAFVFSQSSQAPEINADSTYEKSFADDVSNPGTDYIAAFENDDCSTGLPSIQFRGMTTHLTQDAQTVLAGAAAQIKRNPECKVKVIGYAASCKRCQQVSWDRVNGVIRYLVERQGIAEDRFIFNYGMEGDPGSVDLTFTKEEGPKDVPAPHPNLKTKDKPVGSSATTSKNTAVKKNAPKKTSTPKTIPKKTRQ